MTVEVSREKLESLAPDAASLKAARVLAQSRASGRGLSSLGRAGDVVWGEALGAGAEPYRVAFAAGEPPGFKCSCPSRKSPCKHALALALRFVEHPDGVVEDKAPSWVLDWARARERKAREPQDKPVDAAAQAKRAAAREEKVAGGLAELEVWLRDVVRGGIASLPAQPYGFWDKASARMVDAQARGLARRLREMASLPHTGASSMGSAGATGGWHEEMARQLGLLHLIIEGYKRLDAFSPARQADIRALIGWEVNQKELLERGEAVRDTWLCLAHTQEESEDGLLTGRTWLWGQRCNRAALILRFERVGWVTSELAPAAPLGAAFEGELVFFPGSQGQRALLKENFGAGPRFVPRGLSVPQVLEAWAQALADFPWLGAWPCVLRDVVLVWHEEEMWVVNSDGKGAIPISTRHADKWALLSCGGGQPLSVFGLWDGGVFEPLATAQESQSVHIAPVLRAGS